MSSTHHLSILALTSVALAVVVVLVLVITLLIALIGSRGRAVASILVTVGLLVFCLLAAVRFVTLDESTSTAQLELDRKYVTAEVELAGLLEAQRVLVEPLNHPAGADETLGPSEPATDEEDAKIESPEAAKDASSAPDETTGAEKAESEQPAPDDNRPDWVGAKPFKDGGVYKVPVTVGPWPTSEESMKLLPAAVDTEIAKYAVSRTGHRAGAKLRLPPGYVMSHMIEKDVWEESVKIDSFDDVKHMVGRDVWENSANAADGEWTQLHVLVKFDDEVNRRLDDGWARLLRVERLQAAGVLGAIVLIVLGAVYSYLKIDLKTGGAYRGRLRAGALAAILALVVLVLLNHV